MINWLKIRNFYEFMVLLFGIEGPKRAAFQKEEGDFFH